MKSIEKWRDIWAESRAVTRMHCEGAPSVAAVEEEQAFEQIYVNKKKFLQMRLFRL